MTAPPQTDTELLLSARNLRLDIRTETGVFPVVRGVSLDLRRGRTLAVVGESGSGKTMLGLSLMRLVPPALEHRTTGEVLYFGGKTTDPPADLAGMQPRGGEIRRIRGREIAMIFQEPMTALSPIHTIGNQIVEAIRLHRRCDAAAARARAIALLERVKLPRPEQVFSAYPHELSGGMRQRAMIAMALSCDPKILIADEPTTALDVTIQAQILDLLAELQAESGLAVLLVTHDLGVVAQCAHEVAVMYLGEVVEQAAAEALFDAPAHPYTRGLLASLPTGDDPGRRLIPIPGTVPDPLAAPTGCLFRDRCPQAFARCVSAPPVFHPAEGRSCRCWLREPSAAGGDT